MIDGGRKWSGQMDMNRGLIHHMQLKRRWKKRVKIEKELKVNTVEGVIWAFWCEPVGRLSYHLTRAHAHAHARIATCSDSITLRRNTLSSKVIHINANQMECVRNLLQGLCSRQIYVSWIKCKWETEKRKSTCVTLMLEDGDPKMKVRNIKTKNLTGPLTIIEPYSRSKQLKQRFIIM